MPPFKEIKLALNALEELERFLKNPGGPVEEIIARRGIQVAIAEIEAIAELAQQRELTGV